MKNTELRKLLQDHDPQHIIDTLSPFILDPRKERIESIIENRLDGISIAVECPSDSLNASAIIRSAEAFGLSSVHIITPEEDAHFAMHGISQGACFWIGVHIHKTLEDFKNHIKQENRKLIGAVVDTPNTLGKISIEAPICIFFGNEKLGLSDAAKNICDDFFTIPMYGMVESLNLSVAAAVSLHDLTQRKRRELALKNDLTTAKINQLRAQYYLNSVNQRTIIEALKQV